jgi:hypothetical protein
VVAIEIAYSEDATDELIAEANEYIKDCRLPDGIWMTLPRHRRQLAWNPDFKQLVVSWQG